MRLVVDVQIETPAWRKAWPRLAAETRELLRFASTDSGIAKSISSWPGLTRPPRGKRSSAGHATLAGRVKPCHDDVVEVTVVFADDPKLQDLNAQFRGKNKPTNVLSFPDGENLPGGGIALSFETISAEARTQGKPFVNHAKHMILHGFLHLLGHDHDKPKAARLMEGLEIAMLARMGIPNPYLIEKTRA